MSKNRSNPINQKAPRIVPQEVRILLLIARQVRVNQQVRMKVQIKT